MTTFSACTKLIIAGEHLAVKGFRVLAIPLVNKRTYIEVQDSGIFKVESEIYQEYLERELKLIAADLNITLNQTFKVKFNAEPRIGLGVSASFTVAALKALTNNKITQEDLIAHAHKAEQRTHGTLSGIDHTTIIYEQPVILNFTPSQKLKLIPYYEIFNSIKLINTGVPLESTKQMVEISLANFDQKKWESIDLNFELLLNAIETNNKQEFIKYINLYGEFLEQLGVVNQESIRQAQEYRSKGLGAKICGAGGITNGSGIIMIV